MRGRRMLNNLQFYTYLFLIYLETDHITEITPYGVPPCPRRRCGAALVGAEFVICGGTRFVDECSIIWKLNRVNK